MRGFSVAALAVSVALGTVGVYALGRRFVPGWEWASVVLVAAVVGLVHARLAATWRRRSEVLVEALRAAAEDRQPAGMSAGMLSRIVGSGLRSAVDDIAASVTELREDKRRAELVLANMADGIVAVDCEGRIILLNPAAISLFDRAGADAVGKRLADVDIHPEVARLVHDCAASGHDATAEVRLPGWPQRVISIRATPFRSGLDKPGSAVVILRDLTDLRRHERNQKEFVSNVSHELKTPLTAVRTTAEALLSGAKNDDAIVDRFLNNIITESDRLSVLIEDLMEIARMDSGITPTEKSEVDVARVVERALGAVRPQAASKGMGVIVQIDEGLTAFCDEVQVTHMVRNLADNAVKYTPDGGQIAVRACGSGDGVEITVSDTGIGIPHGELDRVFERFYRVDKARSRRLGGTGLGLAIVKEIVNAHGGQISVDTQLGRGTAFTVRLPFDTRQPEEL